MVAGARYARVSPLPVSLRLPVLAGSRLESFVGKDGLNFADEF